MSAIWGHIDWEKNECSVDSMASEYKRKCKLDRITEKKVSNALFGSGLQIINDEDNNEAMPYVLDEAGNILSAEINSTNGAQSTNSENVFSSEDARTIITADCILDNRDELIAELCNSDAPVKNAIPDGQIICLAYKKWGYNFPAHLRGIFSVAIYNIKEESLFICTDQFAKRCLYYTWSKDRCIFSTLLNSIKSLLPSPEMNKQFIEDYLVAPFILPCITPFDTPWKDIIQLEPGTYIIMNKEGISKTEYYSPQKIRIPKNINKIKEQFLDIYKNSVKGTIRTNGNVSILLSGGFDSSSCGALAAEMLAKQNKNLYSYTYTPYYKEISKSYPPEEITDETRYVELLAKKYPNICPHFDDGDGKDFVDSIDHALEILEIPYKAYINMPSALNTYAKAHDTGSKVVLCGQNGNLTVSYGNAYNSFSHLLSHHRYFTFLNYYFRFAKLDNQKAISFLPRVIEYLKDNKSDDKPILHLTKEQRDPFVNDKIFDNYDYENRLIYSEFLNRGKRLQSEEDYHQLVYPKSAFSYIGVIETKLGLNEGIIIRDPTVSVDLINFCYSLPFELFSYNGIPRYLIRGFMSEYLPREILYPLRKVGIQNADWLIRLSHRADEIYNILEKELLDDSLAQLTDQKKLREYIAEKHPFNQESYLNYLYIFVLFTLKKYISQN